MHALRRNTARSGMDCANTAAGLLYAPTTATSSAAGLVYPTATTAAASGLVYPSAASATTAFFGAGAGLVYSNTAAGF